VVLFKLNDAGVAPTALADTARDPALLFAKSCGEVASPPAFVTAVAVTPLPAKVADAPLPGAVKVTVTPGTELSDASETRATRGAAKAVPTVVDWPEPLETVTAVGEPGVFVNANDRGAEVPDVATTVKLPAVVFAVKVGAVATPDALVAALTPARGPGNVPEGPTTGAVKEMFKAGIGLVSTSVAATERPVL
jgi:hypothetical protein